MEICRPLTDVSAALGRERSDTFTMLNHCVASPEELNLELAWAASRPASRAHAAGFSPSVPLTIASSMAFETALTNCEHKHLLKSQASAPGDRVVSLIANVNARPIFSPPNIMHTLTKSATMQWVNSISRWWSSREMLGFQGFPITDDLLRAFLGLPSEAATLPAACSFNTARLRHGFKRRSRTTIAQQAGNSMHVSVIGAVLCWRLAFVQDLPSIPRSLISLQLAHDFGSVKHDNKRKSAAVVCAGSSSVLSNVLALRSKRRKSTNSVSSDGTSVSGTVASGSVTAGSVASPVVYVQ